MTDTPTTETTTPDAAAPATEAAPVESLLGGASSDVLLGSKTEDKAVPDPVAAVEPVAEVAYEFKDVPENYDAEELTAFAKAHKLSPEAAQQILARDIAQHAAYTEGAQADFKELQTKTWVDALKADPAFKKDWAGSVQTARRGNDALPPEIKAEIDKLGLNNNPVLFKIAHFLGTKLKEDTFVRGDSAPSKSRTFAQVMYGQ